MNPETGDKSGYYRINDTQCILHPNMCWCGRKLSTLIPAQEVTAPVDGIKTLTLVLASVMWPVMVMEFVPLYNLLH